MEDQTTIQGATVDDEDYVKLIIGLTDNEKFQVLALAVNEDEQVIRRLIAYVRRANAANAAAAAAEAVTA